MSPGCFFAAATVQNAWGRPWYSAMQLCAPHPCIRGKSGLRHAVSFSWGSPVCPCFPIKVLHVFGHPSGKKASSPCPFGGFPAFSLFIHKETSAVKVPGQAKAVGLRKQEPPRGEVPVTVPARKALHRPDGAKSCPFPGPSAFFFALSIKQGLGISRANKGFQKAFCRP